MTTTDYPPELKSRFDRILILGRRTTLFSTLAVAMGDLAGSNGLVAEELAAVSGQPSVLLVMTDD